METAFCSNSNISKLKTTDLQVYHMSKKKTVKKKEAVEEVTEEEVVEEEAKEEAAQEETEEEVVEEEAEEEVVEEVKEKKKPAAPKARTEEQRQIIYIGKKNTISYVLVAVTILNKHDYCSIQARGRQISKAVDVAEITRRKFLQDMVEVSSVKIGSEDIASDVEGMPPKTVSTVEITLTKK